MPIRDWFPFLRRKANPVSDLIVLGLWGAHQIIPPKKNLALQAEEGYQRNVTVHSCINLIGRSCAGIPWVLYHRGTGSNTKPQKMMTFGTAAKAFHRAPWYLKARALATIEVENHPLLTLIEKPNPLQGGAEYTETVFGYWLISGNSFETWVGPETGPNKGRPIELWSLRPDRMRIVGGAVGSGTLVDSYQYWVGAGRMSFDPSILLHQKFFSPLDDFYGLSPIQVAAHVIDGDNAAQVWNHKLLLNDAVPRSAFLVKGGLQDDARERFRAELESRFSGPDNARRPMVFEGDLDWKELGIRPVDLDWIEGRKLNRREIAQIYGVPPELIGDVEAQGYASKEQARKSFYEETVLPLMDRRRDNLNNTVTRAFGDGLSLDYDRDQIEAIHEDAQKLYQGIRQADWLSINEKRDATGYDTYTPAADQNVGDVPVAFLKPAQLPGAPEDIVEPGSGTPAPAPRDSDIVDQSQGSGAGKARSAKAALDTSRTVYIVRHGPTDHDKGQSGTEVHDGWLPQPLNANGVAVAERLRTRFSAIRPLALVSSPVVRALETCGILAADDHNVTIRVDYDLGPWRFGSTFEGQVEADVDEALQFYIDHPDEVPPADAGDTTESYNAFRFRIRAVIAKIFADAQRSPSTAVVTHSWDCKEALLYIQELGFSTASTGTKPQPGTVVTVTLAGQGTDILAVSESTDTDAPLPAKARVFTKAQQLSRAQRDAQAELDRKLRGHFKSQAKALAAHLKRGLGA